MAIQNLNLKLLISGFVEDVNTRQRLSFSFPEPHIQSYIIQLQNILATFDELNEMG